eukprot:Skav235228  [mRNA]  locus=scaffold3995:187136:199055:+ [translate_table: standard]
MRTAEGRRLVDASSSGCSQVLGGGAHSLQWLPQPEAGLRTKIKSIISESKASLADDDDEEARRCSTDEKCWRGFGLDTLMQAGRTKLAMVRKVKKSALKKGSELRAAVPPKPATESEAVAPSKKVKKKAAIAKGPEKSTASPTAGDSNAPPAGGKVDKAQLAMEATEEILKGIAKPDSQKISAFVLPDWHLKFKDVLGSYKKFVKSSDKLQVVEREDGNYIIQRAGDTSVPPPPEVKDKKSKDWKQLLLNAWNIYHQATPKQAGPWFAWGSESEAILKAYIEGLVLFDEVEKAHPDVFNLMLQILEATSTQLTIQTSNVGAKAIEKGIQGGGGIGFSGLEDRRDRDGDDAETSSYKRLKTLVFDEHLDCSEEIVRNQMQPVGHLRLKNFFKPEFLNRLDEVIVFRSLTKPEVSQIAELECLGESEETQSRNI